MCGDIYGYVKLKVEGVGFRGLGSRVQTSLGGPCVSISGVGRVGVLRQLVT